MIFDYATQVSSKQAVTGSGTSEHCFVAQLGGGQNGSMFGLRVDEAFVGAGAVDFIIESDTTDAFSAPRVDGAVYGLAAADLPLGRTVPIQLQDAPAFEPARYVRARWVVAGDDFTAGKVTIAMVDAVNYNPSHFTAKSHY